MVIPGQVPHYLNLSKTGGFHRLYLMFEREGCVKMYKPVGCNPVAQPPPFALRSAQRLDLLRFCDVITLQIDPAGLQTAIQFGKKPGLFLCGEMMQRLERNCCIKMRAFKRMEKIILLNDSQCPPCFWTSLSSIFSERSMPVTCRDGNR